MAQLKVKPGKPVAGEITVPGDKSISHRSIMFSALGNGASVIDGFLPSEDCLATVEAMRALGVPIQADLESDKGFGPTRFRVEGQSLRLKAPEHRIDCGNSGTTMRLLSGILAGQTFRSELTGDASLRSRPMGRVVQPLTQMNARIDTLGPKGCAPLVIDGRQLSPMTYELPVASAQVKSAILLAGLFAPGKTTVIEPIPTRDHTERMLRYFHVKVLREGKSVSIYGGQLPEARDFTVPGDISSAAFWIVAAAAVPGSRLLIRNVGLNETRTGILKVMLRMGALVNETVVSDEGERIGNVEIRGRGLKGADIAGEEIPNIIDELPILAVAGALAEGRTTIHDAQELKVKETDRIHAVVSNLRAMGASVEEFFDGMEITGGQPLHGAELPSFADHRIAMAFAIAGLFANGQTKINDTDCVRTSYPGFERDLAQFANVS